MSEVVNNVETQEKEIKPAIKIDKLFKSYGKKEVLKGHNLKD